MTRTVCLSAVCALIVCLPPGAASAQVVEVAGSRALGLGGAFTALADDSSATWWNPAGLAAGPFLDISLGTAVTDARGALPARRDRGTWFAIGTPPFGFSYYRLRYTDIRPFDPTAGGGPGREDGRAAVPVRSLAVSQLGATLVQTLYPGVHIGATVKFVRGTARTSQEAGGREPEELLDAGEDLEGGDGDGAFDVDVGLISVTGPFRLGATVRNATTPAFGELRLPRQARAGAAFEGERAGLAPFTIALDVDLIRYDTGAGDRRVVALGGEHWFGEKRLAVRGGGRINTVDGEGTLTAGISYALRAAFFLDGHVARGGADADRSWGVAARVSF